MEVVEEQPSHTEEQMSKHLKKTILILNFSMMVLGTVGGPLLLRLYFLHGGNRKWLSCWLQTGGCPIIIIPLYISYLYRRRRNTSQEPTKLYFMTPRLLVACTLLGLLIGVFDLLYAYGVSYLPVSTSSLLLSTQLGFTALFAFLVVKQKFTPFSINAVVLLSFGAVILDVDSSRDRPDKESKEQYYEGFFMTLVAAVIGGFMLPMVELTYAEATKAITYTMVMEMQMVMGFVATVFSTVGMLINNDFQAIPREAREFGLGEVRYYAVLIWSTIFWQFAFLGLVCAIFYTSSLFAGIINGVLIPVTEVLAVIFFHEQFNSSKGIALTLSLWGFVSYFYGEYKGIKKLPMMEYRHLDSTN